MTIGATALEMRRAKCHEIGIVEPRHLDCQCVGLDGIAHHERQEPFGHRPVPAAGGYAVDARPHEQYAKDQGCQSRQQDDMHAHRWMGTHD